MENTNTRDNMIKRAATGNNPSKEDKDAVVAYGLEQHRKKLPHLYQPNKVRLKPPVNSPETENHILESMMKWM